MNGDRKPRILTRLMDSNYPKVRRGPCRVAVERSKLTLECVRKRWEIVVSYFDDWRITRPTSNTLTLTRQKDSVFLKIGGSDTINAFYVQFLRAIRLLHIDVSIDTLSISESDVPTSDCAICAGPLEGEYGAVIRLPCCGNAIHGDCAVSCLRYSNPSDLPACPFCRSTECIVCLKKKNTLE